MNSHLEFLKQKDWFYKHSSSPILSVVTFCFPATIDVKRNIFDLCTDTKDCYLAVIEVKGARRNLSVLF